MTAETPGLSGPCPRDEVENLLYLITLATRDAMSIYEKSSHGIPTINSSVAHPLDTVATALALKKSIRILEGACEQLCATLAPPSHTIINVRSCAFYRILLAKLHCLVSACNDSFHPILHACRSRSPRGKHPSWKSTRTIYHWSCRENRHWTSQTSKSFAGVSHKALFPGKWVHILCIINGSK